METLEAQIQASRIATPLLSDDADWRDGSATVSSRWTTPTRPIQAPKAANADAQPEHADCKERSVGDLSYELRRPFAREISAATKKLLAPFAASN
jgi:hypothetical protein